METETLSSYKHVQDKHLLDETMEENSAGNDELVFVENEKRSEENSTEIVSVDDSNTCDEINNIKNKKHNDKGHENSIEAEENVIRQTLSDESDNDVDEEEEHIPLNIDEVNSDSDKSDDDLDETELLHGEDEEKDDLEKSIETDPLDNRNSPVEIQQDEKSLDKNETKNGDQLDDNSEVSVAVPLEDTNEENVDVVDDNSQASAGSKENTNEKNDPVDEDSQAGTGSKGNTNEKNVDPVDENSQASTGFKENPTNERNVESIDENSQASTGSKENTNERNVDLENENSKASIESEENTNERNVDPLDDKPQASVESEESTNERNDQKEDSHNTKNKETTNQVDLSEETNDNKGGGSLDEGITEKDINIDDNKDDNTLEDNAKKNAVDTETEPSVDNLKENVDNSKKMNVGSEKNTSVNISKDSSNDVEMIDDDIKNKNKETEDEDVLIVEKDPLSPDIHEIKDSDNENDENSEKEKTEDATKKDSEEKSSQPETSLLKETLSRDRSEEGGKDNEADEELDMDEDFDPSLLCPDINMEVDEVPVITSSDAPPPAHNRDSSKSPLLYEPIFSTYVDEMTGAEIHFDLTPDEENLRLSTFGEKNPVQYTKIHCTACNVHLGSALDGQGNRFVHPLLKVLICKNCYHFYTSGEFEKDEDGSELYCRWCGQGGQVMCCSGCEMVFCKKCIRINFDRKKLAEIKDSDDWYCFRCNPSQITFQRVHCAEFMEYVRRETQRASTLENPIAYMNLDYTQCCTPQKKKPAEPAPADQPKKKKRKVATTVDPDYDPSKEVEQDLPQPSTSGYKPSASNATPKSNNLVLIAPKPTDPKKSSSTIIPINSNNSFKIGGTTFKPKTNTVISRPRVQMATAASGVRTTTPSPGYIKILPGGIRVPGNAPRQTFTPRPRTIATPVRPAVPTPMKHEWFEKTVRAAARVNSNLSYTLTQLNRAQANATSVEALAVVHNKLQEILSTSINSLIQIRKNLRTEFIAGIKNIRFPPKPQTTTTNTSPAIVTPSTSSQDDDVIFVSPTVSPVPPIITATSTPVTSISLPPSVSLIKKSTPTSTTPNISQPQNGTGVPRSFLRVKSLTALQSVPSECITIPDDPPPPPLTPIKKNNENQTAADNDTIEIIDDKEDEQEKVSDVSVVNGLDKGTSVEVNSVEKKELENKDKENNKSLRNNESVVKDDDGFVHTYNLQDPLLPEIKKMKYTKVILKRSPEIDELVKSKFGKVNGGLET